MATQRTIRGVLGNFLGTYTSRYADYDGYWLFGYLIVDFDELRIDLMKATSEEARSPVEVAIHSAVTKFEDQVRKAGLVRSQIREAQLAIRKLAGSVVGSVNGHRCTGCNVSFSALAVMEANRRVERETIVFVAPHNAEVELRSGRAASP